MSESICPSCHQPLPADAPAGLCPACVLGAALESAPVIDGPSLDELGTAFPQLEILEHIGRGAMGIVYKARQPNLDRLVALKILAPDLSSDPGFAERFSREAKALAKLSHPNIVGIHDFGESGGLFYLLMEYVDGVNLRQAMRASRFTSAQALSLVPKLCSAIQFAHDHGILHRDIKPENILIDTAGRVKIADFGIARLAGEDPALQLTATGSTLGTAAYMAPEQIEDPGNVDHRADIYSLGVVFYEMLTGGLPLGRFPAPSESTDTGPGIDDIVMRALEKQRERRYQRADDIDTDLENGFQSPPPSRNTKATPSSDETTTKLRLWSLGLLFGGLITGAVGFLTSPVILGLGTIAFIFGQIGCWWMLIRMKQGKFSLEWRRLLLAVAFLPGLIAVLWFTSILPLLKLDDVIYSGQPYPLAWVLLSFIAAVVGGKVLWKLVSLKETSTNPVLRRSRKVGGVIGILLLLFGFITAKQLQTHLDLLNRYAGTSFKIREGKNFQKPLNEDDAAVVRKAVAEASGELSDFYRIEYSVDLGGNPLHYRESDDPGLIGLDFICEGKWKDQLAEDHFASFEQRLRALLPARFSIEDRGRGLHQKQLENAQSWTYGFYGIWMIGFIITASFLTVFTGRKTFIISTLSGLTAAVVLTHIDSWSAPYFLPPAKPYRDPLPELAPIFDRSTPRATVESVIRAAKQQDIPRFKDCFSPTYFNLVADPGARFDSDDLKIMATTKILGVDGNDPLHATAKTIQTSPIGQEATSWIRLKREDKHWLIIEVELTPAN